MKAGDKIRVIGNWYEQKDYVVEEFRHCLGIFETAQHRKAGDFTPLCELYEPGPYSKNKYLSNFGEYSTDMVQAWMDLA